MDAETTETVRMLREVIPFRLGLIENAINRDAARQNCEVIRECLDKLAGKIGNEDGASMRLRDHLFIEERGDGVWLVCVEKVHATREEAQQACRKWATPQVQPLFCPKCDALWLHWPKEISGFERDSLNLRSSKPCGFCETARSEQLTTYPQGPKRLDL